MKYQFPLFIAIVSALISCAQQKKTAIELNTSDNPYKLLGKNIDSIPNSSEQFVLYVQKRNSEIRHIPVSKGVVVHRSTSKVVATFQFTPGMVKWISEDEIEVYSAPGMVRKNEDVTQYKRIIKIKLN